MRFVGFIGPSYQLRSVNVDCQRCINLYPEIDELGTGKEKEVAALVGTPGLKTLVTLGAGPIRGVITSSGNVLYAVSGSAFYKIDSSFVATQLGTLLTSTGNVSMTDNGVDLVVVDGTYGYSCHLSTGAFAQITDPAFLPADQVTYQDGYFIFNHSQTGQFYISQISSVTFNALDFASSEGNPDNVIGILSNHRELWLFNYNTIEVFYNSGDANFPFSRIEGAFVEYGCAAPFSVAKINNAVFWLGRDERGQGIVFQSRGYQPARISTTAIEFAIQSYSNISDAVAYTYQDCGHFFYVLNFPTANTTWVFDSSTNLWHERAYSNAGTLERHRANCHAFGYSKHVVGDYANGKIYELNSSYYDDDGTQTVRRRVSPHVSQSLDRIFYNTFQLDVETGVGIDGLGQGVDPQAMLQWSDDGGHTWSNEKWTSLGKIGQTKARSIWRRLGTSRDRVFRVSISDPVKVVIIGAEIDLVQGAS